MKLFVDDIRACPEGWTPARTVTEAIRILSKFLMEGEIQEVSLDHDISCRHTYTICSPLRPFSSVEHEEQVDGQWASPETFEPVARYLALAKGLWRLYADQDPGMKPFPHIRIHTGNFEEGARMAQLMGVPYGGYVYNEKDYE